MKEMTEKTLEALNAIYDLTNNGKELQGSFFSLVTDFVKKPLAQGMYDYLRGNNILLFSGNKRSPLYTWSREKAEPNYAMAENIVANYVESKHIAATAQESEQKIGFAKQKAQEYDKGYENGVKDTIQKMSEMQSLVGRYGFQIDIRKRTV
jgi:hypothetical protein